MFSKDHSTWQEIQISGASESTWFYFFFSPNFLFVNMLTESVKWIKFLGGFLDYKQQEKHPSRFLFITFPIRFAWHWCLLSGVYLQYWERVWVKWGQIHDKFLLSLVFPQLLMTFLFFQPVNKMKTRKSKIGNNSAYSGWKKLVQNSKPGFDYM